MWRVVPFLLAGTAGNTGIGLAHICNARGYKLVIYMPNTQSQEKIDLLRVLGAEVRPVPAVAITDKAHYTFQARDYAASLPNGFWANQFDNTGAFSRMRFGGRADRVPSEFQLTTCLPFALQTTEMRTTQRLGLRSGLRRKERWTHSFALPALAAPSEVRRRVVEHRDAYAAA